MKKKDEKTVVPAAPVAEETRPSRFSERTKRRLRFGSNWFALIAVVMVAFVLFNIVLEQLPLSLDFTREKLYTLTEETEKQLEELDKEIEIIALYDEVKGRADSSRSMIMKVLDLYERYDNVSVRYVDLSVNPTFVRDLVGEDLVSDYTEGDYIVRCDKRVRRIASNSMFTISQVNLFYSAATGLMAEPMINAAIRYVQQEKVPVIYFSNGFGEKDLSLYTNLQQNIEAYGYLVGELNLSQEEIPEDAAMLVFLGPSRDLSAVAKERLNVYFNQGAGYALFYMDSQTTGVELNNFNDVFATFGVAINNDLVEEKDALTGDPYGFSANILTNGPFADREGASGNVARFFESRSLRFLNTTGNYTTYPLVYTSEEATSIASVGGEKLIGKCLIAAASEYTTTTSLKSSKIVVSGSSLSLQDSYMSKWQDSSGGGMFVYYMNWMYSSVLSDPGMSEKPFDSSTVVTTESQQTQLFAFAVVIFPLLILVIGGVIWFRRRHL